MVTSLVLGSGGPGRPSRACAKALLGNSRRRKAKLGGRLQVPGIQLGGQAHSCVGVHRALPVQRHNVVAVDARLDKRAIL